MVNRFPTAMLTMEDPNLVLVGSRPASRTGSYPSHYQNQCDTPTTPVSSALNWRDPGKRTSYEKRLFGSDVDVSGPHGGYIQKYAREPESYAGRRAASPQQPLGAGGRGTWTKGLQSGHSGAATRAGSGSARHHGVGHHGVGFSAKSSNREVNSLSGQKSGSHTERPPPRAPSAGARGNRPHSARSGSGSATGKGSSQIRTNHTATRRAAKLTHTPSYVDELLFGPKPAEPDFQAPWGETSASGRPYHFDCTDYKRSGSARNGSVRSGARTPPSRPVSRTGLVATTPKKQQQHQQASTAHAHGSGLASRQGYFKPSYVDEALFGPKPQGCDWEAPWGERDRKAEATLIFDAFDHKVTIDHDNVNTVKPKTKILGYTHSEFSTNGSRSGEDERPPWR